MKRRMSFKSKDDPMLIQSLSDDQLYRGKRRASIPNNFSIHQKESLKDVGTSNGKPILRRKIIEFEGDGPLGIIFKDKDKLMCVKSIMKGSVASEYSELNEGMIVSQINDVNCSELGYFKSMECLGKLWREKSCVTLHFKYEDVNDIINTPVNNPIYKFLEDADCEEFYDCFVELGATELDDLQFIEYDDLTESAVLAWVYTSLIKGSETAAEAKARVEQECTDKVTQLIALKAGVATGVPW